MWEKENENLGERYRVLEIIINIRGALPIVSGEKQNGDTGM